MKCCWSLYHCHFIKSSERRVRELAARYAFFEINSVSPLRGGTAAHEERRKRGSEGGEMRKKRGQRGKRRNGEEKRLELTHPAVACLRSSSGTYASLDCLKERPAFPHHLNRLVPLLFHSLEGSPIKTHLPYPLFSSSFLPPFPNHLNSR